MRKSTPEQALDPFSTASAGRPVVVRRPISASKEQVPTTRELGRRFRVLRKGQGMTLDEVAKKVGSGPRTLSKFEREGKITGELLLRLIGTMSSASGFADAFEAPLYSDIRHVITHARSVRG